MVCLADLLQSAQVGRWLRVVGGVGVTQRSQTIRPDHQIFNDSDQQLPQRGGRVDSSGPSLQTELELDFPLTLLTFARGHTHTRATMGSCLRGFVTDFFTYETTKSVVVKSWSVGIINRIVQLLIITYFVGSVAFVFAWFFLFFFKYGFGSLCSTV